MLSRSDKLKRKKINKFLSFIVICVTLSILILPAFTLEKKDDDTNDNNGPTTAQNINEQGGQRPLRILPWILLQTIMMKNLLVRKMF